MLVTPGPVETVYVLVVPIHTFVGPVITQGVTTVTVMVVVAVKGQPFTVALKVIVNTPPLAGAVNILPLTPVPLHTILVTVVPVGNPTVNSAVAPGQSGPIGGNVGGGTVVTMIGRVAVTGQPFTVALKVTM